MTTPSTHAPALDAVVEILITWGATADAALSDLIQAVDALHTGREPTREQVLQGALSDFSDLLAPELTKGISRALEGGADEPTLDALHDRLVESLSSTIGIRLREIAGLATQWALHGEPGRVADVWARIGTAERAESGADLLEGARLIREAEHLLDGQREATVAEIRRLAATEDAIPVESPAALLDTLRRLRDARSQTDLTQKTTELDREQEALAMLVEKAAAAAPPEGGRASTGTELLRLASATGSRVAQAPTSPVADVDARLEAVRSWTEHLQVLLSKVSPDPVEHVAPGLVDTLRNELLELSARAGETPESLRPPAAVELERIAGELASSAGQGGEGFQQAFARGLESARAVRASLDAEVQRAGERLRAAAGRLATTLTRAASQLLTSRIASARLHLEQVDSVIAERDIAGIGALEQVIQREVEKLEHDVALVDEHRHDREEIRREMLREEIHRLTPAAKGRRAASLKTLSSKLPRARGPEIDQLLKQVRSVGREVEGKLRVDAGNLLARAGKLPPGFDKGLVGKLQAAVREGDLESMGACSANLASALRQEGARRRRMLFAVGGAALVLVLAGGGFFLLRGPAVSGYDLHLNGSKGGEEVLLIFGDDESKAGSTGQDGNVHFDLPPGRYEIFVNRKYTGRVLYVPKDATAVDVTVPDP